MKVPLLKQTAEAAIRVLAPPSRVCLPLAGMVPCVDSGARVRVGTLVARSPEGAPYERRCHSPLEGIATVLEDRLFVEGEPGECLPIDTGGDIVSAALGAGLVGMGGGVFPTYLKLVKPERPIDSVIVNACQSEPYVTCDYRVLVEHRAEVDDGLALAMRALDAGRGLIANGDDSYPSGDERLLVWRELGRRIPRGQRPQDVGALVLNVQTARALHQAVRWGRPLVDRVVTVDGAAVGRPGNYLVPLGTSVGHVLAACDTDMSRAAAITAGGPMMGYEADVDSPIVAGTIAILALTASELAVPADEPCIRCGRCHDACPYDLFPSHLAGDPDASILTCVGCGLCEFSCPARRPLTAHLRAARDRFLEGSRG